MQLEEYERCLTATPPKNEKRYTCFCFFLFAPWGLACRSTTLVIAKSPPRGIIPVSKRRLGEKRNHSSCYIALPATKLFCATPKQNMLGFLFMYFYFFFVSRCHHPCPAQTRHERIIDLNTTTSIGCAKKKHDARRWNILILPTTKAQHDVGSRTPIISRSSFCDFVIFFIYRKTFFSIYRTGFYSSVVYKPPNIMELTKQQQNKQTKN